MTIMRSLRVVLAVLLIASLVITSDFQAFAGTEGPQEGAGQEEQSPPEPEAEPGGAFLRSSRPSSSCTLQSLA